MQRRPPASQNRPQQSGKNPAFRKTLFRSFLDSLQPVEPQSISLRDGEVVVYRRSRSLLYQCRYKLADGSWVRQSTGQAALEHAVTRACDIYDEARFRQRLGLAHRAQSFAQIASEVLQDLRRLIDANSGKTAYHTRRPAHADKANII